MTSQEVIDRFSFMDNGQRVILFKLSKYVPAKDDEGYPQYISLAITDDLNERIGMLDVPYLGPGSDGLFKGAKMQKYCVIMHPNNYPGFADMMAGRVVLYEYGQGYEVIPKRGKP